MIGSHGRLSSCTLCLPVHSSPPVLGCAILQGLGATILRNTPANSVYLGSFEVLKQEASRRLDLPVSKLPAWAVVGSAGVGGILYWWAHAPTGGQGASAAGSGGQ